MDDLADRLPEIYAAYFELRRCGAARSEVAAALDLSEESLDVFIDLAHRKLTNSGSEWRDVGIPGRMPPWVGDDRGGVGR